MPAKPKDNPYAPFTDDELAAIALRGPRNTATDWRWLTTIANLKLQIQALEESLARTKKGGRKAGAIPHRSTVWRHTKKAEKLGE